MRVLTVAALLAIGTAAGHAAPAPTPKDLYTSLLAREKTVRQDLDAADPPRGTLTRVRSLIASWEKMVRRFPRSGYSDNALWQAARLAADAHRSFGAAADRTTAERLFAQLKAQFPSSSLVKRIGAELTALRTPPPPPVPPPAPEPAPAETAAAISSDAPAAALASPSSPAVLRDIRRTVLGDLVRVTLELDREVRFHEERIADPDRVFVDLRATRAEASLSPLTFDDHAVRGIRLGQQPGETTRVVLDLDGVRRYSVFTLYNPYRLVIDCERMPEVVPAVARSVGSGPAAPPPPVRAEAGRPAEPAPSAPVAETLDSRRPAAGTTLPPAPTTPRTNLQGRYSLSRQLGLGVARIVIDPGHGGHDPGVQSRGLQESELVLDVALRLEKLLLRNPGIEVVLTRRTDVFIDLEERTAMANREGADLFLSIHANASRRTTASGIETYFLNFASNPEAEEVAARENSASAQTMHRLPDIVKAIALNNKLDESRDFATIVQRAMLQGLKPHNAALRDRGVKQAPFVVLIGAGMPSVLAEISFVTHPQEGRLLKTRAYRQQIAEALYEGVMQYQRSLKNVRTVANQD